MDTLPPCASRRIEISARGGRAARKEAQGRTGAAHRSRRTRRARRQVAAHAAHDRRTRCRAQPAVVRRSPATPLAAALLRRRGHARMGRPHPPVVRNSLVHRRVSSASSKPEPASRPPPRRCRGLAQVPRFRRRHRMARVRPGSRRKGNPRQAADEIMSHDEIYMLYLGLYDYRIIRCRAPPEYIPDLRTFAIDLARYVGFRTIQATTHARRRETLERNDNPHASHCRTQTDKKRGRLRETGQ